jgi:hypothetical protein
MTYIQNTHRFRGLLVQLSTAHLILYLIVILHLLVFTCTSLVNKDYYYYYYFKSPFTDWFKFSLIEELKYEIFNRLLKPKFLNF